MIILLLQSPIFYAGIIVLISSMFILAITRKYLGNNDDNISSHPHPVSSGKTEKSKKKSKVEKKSLPDTNVKKENHVSAGVNVSKTTAKSQPKEPETLASNLPVNSNQSKTPKEIASKPEATLTNPEKTKKPKKKKANAPSASSDKNDIDSFLPFAMSSSKPLENVSNKYDLSLFESAIDSETVKQKSSAKKSSNAKTVGKPSANQSTTAQNNVQVTSNPSNSNQSVSAKSTGTTQNTSKPVNSVVTSSNELTQKPQAAVVQSSTVVKTAPINNDQSKPMSNQIAMQRDRQLETALQLTEALKKENATMKLDLTKEKSQSISAINALKKDAQTKEQEIAVLKKKVAVQDEDLKKHKYNQESLANSFQIIQAELSRNVTRADSLTREKMMLEKQLEHAKHEVEKLRSGADEKLEAMRLNFNTRESELRALNETITKKAVTEALDECKRGQLETEVELRHQLGLANERRDQMVAEMRRLNDHCATAVVKEKQDAAMEREKEMNRAQTELSRVRTENEALKSRLAGMHRELELSQSSIAKNTDHKEFEKQKQLNEDLKKSLSVSEQKIAQLNQKLTELSSSGTDTQENLKSHQKSMETLEQENKNLNYVSQCQKTQIDQLTNQNRYLANIEKTLNQKLSGKQAELKEKDLIEAELRKQIDNSALKEKSDNAGNAHKEPAAGDQTESDATSDSTALKSAHDEIDRYKNVLANTETVLSKLQQSVNDEEAKWRQSLLDLEHENDLLKQEIQRQNEEQENRCLRDQIGQLELDLKKLNEERKNNTASAPASGSSDKKGKKKKGGANSGNADTAVTPDSNTTTNDKDGDVDSVLEKLRAELQAEVKSKNQLAQQNTKLKALVKIGQDALREEQMVVQKLKSQHTKLGNSNSSNADSKDEKNSQKI